MPKHLFILSHEAIQASCNDEVAATVEGLKTLGLYHLPYPHVTVRLPNYYVIVEGTARVDWENRGELVQDSDGRWHLHLPDHYYIEYTNLNLQGDPIEAYVVCDGPPGYERWEVDARDVATSCQGTMDILITLLATRNAVKTTRRDKLASLGIGSKHRNRASRFEYTTTISVPSKLEEDHGSVQEGRPKAAHLRRGHIRNQHYGPNNAYRKQIWIEPVFVNADQDFVSTRKAYNLGSRGRSLAESLL